MNEREREDLQTIYVDEAATQYLDMNENRQGSFDDQQTVSIDPEEAPGGLPSGWLVCIKGPLRGRDFRIYPGFNRIGRNPESDIPLTGDGEITRENHCSIVYDAKSGRHYAAQGRGTITYVNGEPLEQGRPLQAGDLLEVGGSTLEFVPFCREGHTWKEL